MSRHLGEEEILACLDPRGTAKERDRLERHLRECPGCREQLSEFRSLWGVLEEWRAADPSPGFEAALRERLAGESRSGGFWPWGRLRPALGLALLGAALVLAVVVGRQAPTPPVPITERELESRTEPHLPSASALLPGEDRALLDNAVLLENYELLEEFDVLFEPVPAGEEKL